MIRAMKKVKYVIKATKFKDNTYEDVVFENQPLSQKQETFEPCSIGIYQHCFGHWIHAPRHALINMAVF